MTGQKERLHKMAAGRPRTTLQGTPEHGCPSESSYSEARAGPPGPSSQPLATGWPVGGESYWVRQFSLAADSSQEGHSCEPSVGQVPAMGMDVSPRATILDGTTLYCTPHKLRGLKWSKFNSHLGINKVPENKCISFVYQWHQKRKRFYSKNQETHCFIPREGLLCKRRPVDLTPH